MAFGVLLTEISLQSHTVKKIATYHRTGRKERRKRHEITYILAAAALLESLFGLLLGGVREGEEGWLDGEV